jgi:hypothetical protein
MEIVITRTGTHFHLDATVAKAFIEAGLAEQYVAPAYTPAPAQHIVGLRQSYSPPRQGDRVPEDKMLVIELDLGPLGRTWYDGPPANAKEHFIKVGHPCPDWVLAEYKERYGKPLKRLESTARGVEFV